MLFEWSKRVWACGQTHVRSESWGSFERDFVEQPHRRGAGRVCVCVCVCVCVWEEGGREGWLAVAGLRCGAESQWESGQCKSLQDTEEREKQQLPTDHRPTRPAGQQRRCRAHITTPVSTTQHLNRDYYEETLNIPWIFTFRQVERSVSFL